MRRHLASGDGAGQREPETVLPPPGRRPLTAGYVARNPHGSDTVQRAAAGAEPSPSSDPVLIAHGGVSDGGGPLPYLDVVQRSFGRHDVGATRFHTGAAAETASRALGARAYTVGGHVASAGAPDLHTVAHEAAHVVQQRGGVSLQRGLGAAGDAHERHADAVADRVVAGESAEDLLDLYGGAGSSDGGTVQRAVGFEWEVDSLMLDEVTKKGDMEEPAPLPSKAVAYQRGGVRVEVDSGHGEFVTEPAESMNQLDVQLGVIGEVVEDLKSAGQHGLYMRAPGEIVFTDDKGGKRGKTWMKEGGWIRAYLKSATVTGTFQATSGVDFTPKALSKALRASVQHYEKGSQDHWLKEIEKAEKTASAAPTGNIATLVLAVEYFVSACAHGTGSAEDGPKTWMPLLLRTDFRSMFQVLESKEQAEFVGWVKKRSDLDKPLCPSGYVGAKQKEKGPTIGEWLQSVCEGRKGRDPSREADKDLMSPPPGFDPHLTRKAQAKDREEGKPVAVPIPYAMGLYGLDDGKIIAEQRQMTKQGGMQSGKLGYDDMCKLARSYAAEAGLEKLDLPSLDPPLEPEPEPEPMSSDDKAIDDEVVEAEEVVIDKSKRNWYQKLCSDAKETIAVYGKGMFDYGEIGADEDALGSTRLTSDHLRVFGLIRAERSEVAFDPHLLEFAYGSGETDEEIVFVYLDVVDSL